MRPSTLLLILLLAICTAQAQPDSILDQGVYRKYIVHLPSGYNSQAFYPLVLNFHGLGSNAAEQQLYTQMDPIADDKGYIVVYPDAINGSWSEGLSGGPDDLQFAANLLDSLRADFNIDNCIFATGMSMGGFMTYKLACTPSFEPNLTAVAVVTGNMATAFQNASNPTPLPVMHFHGTDDAVVHYNGDFGVPSVETTMAWWAGKNGCLSTPTITQLLNTSTTDNSTVELYDYGMGNNLGTVRFYKITGGGHTWPGPIDVPSLGVTNHDIVASQLIMDFFEEFCNLAVGIPEQGSAEGMNVFPNPSNGIVTIRLPENTSVKTVTVTDCLGRIVARFAATNKEFSLDLSPQPGIYTLAGTDEKGVVSTKTVVIYP